MSIKASPEKSTQNIKKIFFNYKHVTDPVYTTGPVCSVWCKYRANYQQCRGTL